MAFALAPWALAQAAARAPPDWRPLHRHPALALGAALLLHSAKAHRRFRSSSSLRSWAESSAALVATAAAVSASSAGGTDSAASPPPPSRPRHRCNRLGGCCTICRRPGRAEAAARQRAGAQALKGASGAAVARRDSIDALINRKRCKMDCHSAEHAECLLGATPPPSFPNLRRQHAHIDET